MMAAIVKGQTFLGAISNKSLSSRHFGGQYWNGEKLLPEVKVEGLGNEDL